MPQQLYLSFAWAALVQATFVHPSARTSDFNCRLQANALIDTFAVAQGGPMVRTLRSRATFWLAASVMIGNTVSARP
jgi:hypothetical protein